MRKINMFPIFTCCLFLILIINTAFAQLPEFVASGFVFPEGPSFDREGNLFVVDCQTHTIAKITPDGKSSAFITTPGRTNGSIIDREGNLYLAGWDVPMILKVRPDGIYTVYKSSYNGEPLQGPNDFAIDPEGRLYFTDPLYGKNPAKSSRVLFVDTDGEVRWLADIPGYTNGLVFGKEPHILYVAETLSRQIWRVNLNLDGSAREKSILITLPEPDYPDGLTVDANGDIYAAAFNSGCIKQISPGGKIKRIYTLPGSMPTNCEFGGPENNMLYVTEVETKSVYRIRMDVPGMPVR